MLIRNRPNCLAVRTIRRPRVLEGPHPNCFVFVPAYNERLSFQPRWIYRERHDPRTGNAPDPYAVVAYVLPGEKVPHPNAAVVRPGGEEKLAAARFERRNMRRIAAEDLRRDGLFLKC